MNNDRLEMFEGEIADIIFGMLDGEFDVPSMDAMEAAQSGASAMVKVLLSLGHGDATRYRTRAIPPDREAVAV